MTRAEAQAAIREMRGRWAMKDWRLELAVSVALLVVGFVILPLANFFGAVVAVLLVGLTRFTYFSARAHRGIAE